MQSYMQFFKSSNIDVYRGVRVVDNIKDINKIISKVYYEFMCKRVDKSKFQTKTGVVIEVKIPSNINYICAMSIKYISDMNFRIVVPIGE